MTAQNKNGPRKLKSWPLLTAQNVYRVRLTTATAVTVADSRIIFPVIKSSKLDQKRNSPFDTKYGYQKFNR